MNKTGLVVTLPSDREIAMTRSFHAPKASVFRALTEPDLLKRWLLGPDGWSLVVCTIDLKIGGAYRYEWKRTEDGSEIAMGGIFLEITPPERLVVTERFDQSWYPGEAVVTTTLEEREGVTQLILTVRYESKEARDEVLKTSMDEGVGASYNRLEEMLRDF